LVDEDLVAGDELVDPGEDPRLALLPVREQSVDVADDDGWPGLPRLPLVAVDVRLLPRVPTGLLRREDRRYLQLAVVGQPERDQRRADLQPRQVDRSRVRLHGVDRRQRGLRRGRGLQRVGVVLGAAPHEKERGTEHQGQGPHAGPTPVATPPSGTATSSSVTCASVSPKSLPVAGEVSWPGSQAMRSPSASSPNGSSSGVRSRICCAVRPSASGKSLQSRSTKGTLPSMISSGGGISSLPTSRQKFSSCNRSERASLT